MSINKVGKHYFVVLLKQQKSGWGLTIREAIQNALKGVKL